MQTVLNTIANMSRNTTENNNEDITAVQKPFCVTLPFWAKKSLNGNCTSFRIEVAIALVIPRLALFILVQYAIARRIFMAHFDQE